MDHIAVQDEVLNSKFSMHFGQLHHELYFGYSFSYWTASLLDFSVNFENQNSKFHREHMYLWKCLRTGRSAEHFVKCDV